MKVLEQAVTCAAEPTRRSQTWYWQPCINNALFLDIPKDTLTGYSSVVMIRSQNQKIQRLFGLLQDGQQLGKTKLEFLYSPLAFVGSLNIK